MVEAQFAQPFLIATALVHGKVGIAEVDGLGTPRVWRCRIGSPASRWMAYRNGRSASRFTGPTGARLPSRPPIRSGRRRSLSPMISSRSKFRDCARNAAQPSSLVHPLSNEDLWCHTTLEEVRFALDSPLEGTGFEPSVPPRTERPWEGPQVDPRDLGPDLRWFH